MTVFCFTFGCCSPLASYYVEIPAENELQARARMICLFSGHWGSVYPRDGFDRQIRDYGLQRLGVNLDASVRLGTNFDPPPRDLYDLAYSEQAVQP